MALKPDVTNEVPEIDQVGQTVAGKAKYLVAAAGGCSGLFILNQLAPGLLPGSSSPLAHFLIFQKICSNT